MTYEKIAPPTHLKRYVRYFWAYERSEGNSASKTFRPITDGCPGLIVQLSEKAPLYDQNKKQLPALCLYGQTIRHREIQASENFNVVGVCFSPFALKAIFGIDADELTDTCTDLDSFIEKQEVFLAERLVSAPSTSQRIELLSSCLWTQIRQNDNQRDRLTEYALSQLVEAEGNLSLKRLQETLNVSERNLERRFRCSVGISPKLFARICQFQASLHQLKTNSYDKLSDIAFEKGYTDQSHFIRVFKEFAGFAPHQYRSQSNEVVENLAEWT